MIGAVVGVDLGATKTSAALVLDDAEVRHAVTAPTPSSQGARTVLDATARLIAEIADRARRDGSPPPRAVGVGAAGTIDDHGTVSRATDHIAGWTGTALADELADRCELPVTALNDVHAHALGEALAGAGRGHSIVLLVAVGSGVGSALVVDGAVLRGAHGAAGGLGHVPCAAATGLRCPCGSTGHLEAIASGPGLLAAYRRLGGDADDLVDVFDRAAAGDALARDVVALGAREIGDALAGAISLADPDIAIITGGVARPGSDWWAEMERRAAAAARADGPCAVLPAETGPLSAVLGAAARARTMVPTCIR